MQIVIPQKGVRKKCIHEHKNKKKKYSDYSSEKNPREYVCRILVLR